MSDESDENNEVIPRMRKSGGTTIDVEDAVFFLDEDPETSDLGWDMEGNPPQSNPHILCE